MSAGRLRLGLGLGLGLALALALPAVAEGRPQRRQRPRAARPALVTDLSRGRVSYATFDRVYLDRGAEHGLSVGAKVPLTRRGRIVGTCVVDQVAPTSATCKGRGRVGDTFAVRARPRAEEKEEARAPQPSRERLAALGAQLSYLSQPMVESGSVGRVLARRLNAELWLLHTTHAVTSTAVGPYQLEQLHLTMRDAELGVLGLSLSLDATAVRWSRRPSDTRYAGASSQLLVRQAEVSARQPGSPLVLSAGRVWPLNAPGMGTFDGLQFGWRSAAGGAELGLLAGMRPETLSLSPALSWSVLGAYVGLQHADPTSPVRRVHQAARLAMVSGPDAQRRFELETSLQAWMGELGSAAAQVRAAVDGPQARVEAARVDFGLAPAAGLRLSGGLRYTNGWFGELLELGSTRPGLRAFHADARAAYDVNSSLTLSAQGGHLRDIVTGLSRTFVGPEVTLPRLLGSQNALSVGYQQELGWLEGRTAYMQLTSRPLEPLRLLARLSYLEDRWTTEAPADRDVGAYLAADVRLLRWLSVRAAMLGRQGIAGRELGGPRSGLSGHAGLAGEL